MGKEIVKEMDGREEEDVELTSKVLKKTRKKKEKEKEKMRRCDV